MHTITVKLKQHTPLIHFQHDQEGATLRASEVKPKLDKYILKKLKEENITEYKKGIAEGWIKNKNGKIWLDYKMRIDAVNLMEPVDPNELVGYNANGKAKYKKSPMFFANMGDNNEKKYYSQCDNCILKITTSSLMLKDVLVGYVGDFFIRTNFGTRQSKGYGSFTVASSSPKTIVHVKKMQYFTVIGGQDRLFEEMEWIHKALRGGINDCFGEKLYFKSLMFSYAKTQNHQQWEKKTIKLRYYPRLLEEQMVKHNGSDNLMYKDDHFINDNTYYDYRDCLGLSSIEQWKIPYDKTIKKENETIERLKSPLTFKPVYYENEKKWKVYFVWEELPKEFLGSKLKVKSNDRGDLELTIPPDFSLKEYFDYLFKKDINGKYKVDISSLFLVKDNTQKMNEIIRMFNELRNSYDL